MLIYQPIEIPWQVIIPIISIACLLLGYIIGHIIGRRQGHKDEPDLWRNLRYYKRIAQMAINKRDKYRAIVKSVKISIADEE